MDVANTIRKQLGGGLFMIGAKNLLALPSGLSFRIMKNAKGVTHVTVHLTSDDTYTVIFTKVGRYASVRDLHRAEGVYVEDLKRVIGEHTNLSLSL